MSASPSSTEQAIAHAGEKIRALRQEQGFTQQELAARAGINTSTLSLLESGKRPGTIEVHGKLARALGITMSELYAGLEGAGHATVSFPPAAPRTETYVHPDRGFAIQPLTTNVLEKRMMPVLVQLEIGGGTVEEQARAGTHTEKFVYVQSGHVEVRVGEERIALRDRQSVYFDATLPHAIRNTGTCEANLFLVVSPPML